MLFKKIEEYIPHRPPMVLVTQLLSVTDNKIEALASLSSDIWFIRPDGFLEPATYVEILAQCFAAGSGVTHPQQIGYLAGIKKLQTHALVRPPCILKACVEPITSLANIIALRGTLFHGQEQLAQAEFKIYVPNQL